MNTPAIPAPDYTGTWKFNPRRSALMIPSPDASLFVIDHREPLFRLMRTHVVRGNRDVFAIELTTDGREVVVERGDLRMRARAFWHDGWLTFDAQLIRAGEEGVNTVQYTLAPDGQAIVAAERFRSASINYHNTWWLDRVADGTLI